MQPIYPLNWPRCVFCGDYALDGHLTCGRASCPEGAARDERRVMGEYRAILEAPDSAADIDDGPDLRQIEEPDPCDRDEDYLR